MKKLIALVTAFAIAAALALPAAGGAAGGTTGGKTNGGNGGGGGQKTSKADERFLLEALQTDLFEVKGGEVAQKQGQSQGVKKLGKVLSRDHAISYAQGKKVARKVGAPVPKVPSAAQKAELQKIGAKKGAAFDKAFTAAQIVGHEKAIRKADAEVKGGSDAVVVALAKKDRKMYEMHLEEAEEVSQELPGGKGGE